jgi:predicted DNA-binding protein
MPRTYTRNIEIKDLPMATNNILNTLARLRGSTKIVIVREALIEYARNHMKELNVAASEIDDDTEEAV